MLRSAAAKIASYGATVPSSCFRLPSQAAQESVNWMLGPPTGTVFQGHAPLR